MTRTWRKTALAAGALILAMLLTSCIRVDVDIELDGGTASGSMVLAVSRQLLERAEADSQGFEDLFSDLFDDTDVPEGAAVEPYEDDEFVGERYTFENAGLGEIYGRELSIVYDEAAGQYEVDGVMDFTSEAGGVPPAMAPVVESFDVSVSITFPGEVIEHNGELDGTTVTWEPAFGEVTELRAVAEDDGSNGLTWLWMALAVIAALLVIGFVVFFGRRATDQTWQRGRQGTQSPISSAG